MFGEAFLAVLIHFYKKIRDAGFFLGNLHLLLFIEEIGVV
jgi:hypothetical protein